MNFTDLLAVWVAGPRADGVPSNTATPIELPRGSDVVLGVTVIDSGGDLVDLDLAGADRLVLSVRQTFNVGVLFDVQAAKLAELGEYTFTITSTQTIDYDGRLVYDVWATRAGAQQQVMRPAYLTLVPRMLNP